MVAWGVPSVAFGGGEIDGVSGVHRLRIGYVPPE